MSKITITDITSGFGSTTQLNAKFQQVEDELNNKVLYRDNPDGEPNQMENSLDMNNNRVYNLGRAVASKDALSLGQFLEYANQSENLTGVVPITWEYVSTGDTTYNLPLATTDKVDMYIVSVDGIVRSPSTYIVNTTNQTIIFDAPVPAVGTDIVVRLFGKTPEATADSITINNLKQTFRFDIATNETNFPVGVTLDSSATDVFLNGIKLVYLIDFTISNQTVVLTEPGTPGDVLEVVIYNSIVVVSDTLIATQNAAAEAQAYAAQAAQSVIDAAAQATAAVDAEFSTVTATASTLAEGSPATASFNTLTNELSLGIPVGATGADITWLGAYNALTAYVVNDAVSYNGSSYICKLASTGNLPTNTTYWDLMASKGDTGPGVPIGGTAGQILSKVDGTDYNTTWIDNKVGDVVGPASATNNNFAAFDGTTGKLIKDSTYTSTSFDAAGTTATHAALTTGTHGVTGTIVGTSDSQVLTNKTINLTSNTLTGTTAQFNTALSDGDFATLAGTESLTNKTIISTTNTVYANAGPSNSPFGFRNKIIGGDFTLNPWQRGTTFTAPILTAYTADRWRVEHVSDAVVDILKTADAPTAAQANHYTAHCIHADVTTADASIAAGQYYIVAQTIEGYNAASLGFGQAGTRYVTLSFWHKHTKTGTYCVSLENSALTRSYVAEYTQAVTDTWEKATLTIPVDTTSGWNYDHTTGVKVQFTIAAGTTLQTTANTWAAGDYLATANQVNGLDNVANNFKIALVQLEAGELATPFEARDRGTELALCQRYYYRHQAAATGDNFSVGNCNQTTTCVSVVHFPTTMRIAPTALEQTGTATDYRVQYQNSAAILSAVPTVSNTTPNTSRIVATTAAVLTVGQVGLFQAATSAAYLGFTSEL